MAAKLTLAQMTQAEQTVRPAPKPSKRTAAEKARAAAETAANLARIHGAEIAPPSTEDDLGTDSGDAGPAGEYVEIIHPASEVIDDTSDPLTDAAQTLASAADAQNLPVDPAVSAIATEPVAPKTSRRAAKVVPTPAPKPAPIKVKAIVKAVATKAPKAPKAPKPPKVKAVDSGNAAREAKVALRAMGLNLLDHAQTLEQCRQLPNGVVFGQREPGERRGYVCVGYEDATVLIVYTGPARGDETDQQITSGASRLCTVANNWGVRDW